MLHIGSGDTVSLTIAHHETVTGSTIVLQKKLLQAVPGSWNVMDGAGNPLYTMRYRLPQKKE
jgi:hypothetical protein